MENKSNNGKTLMRATIAQRHGNRRLSDLEFHKLIGEARKDPVLKKEIKEFIKIATGVYKLKDYGLEKIGLE